MYVKLIIDTVIKDCESVTQYIETAKKRRSNKDLTDEQLKILYIADHWVSLSAYYLSVIPWFITHLNSYPEEVIVTNLKQEIQSIQKSKTLIKTTKNIVDKVEVQMGVPKTLTL